MISVDEILSPESATAIVKAVGSDSSFASIMQSKSDLAKWISYGLIPVFEGQDGDFDSAKDQFEQALLNRLVNAYDTSAVVQTPFGVSAHGEIEGGTGQAPRVFGSIAPPEPVDGDVVPKEKTFTLSNGKLELNASDDTTNTSYLNFLATAKNPSEQAEISLDLIYNPVFIEHLIEADESDYGYVPSSWLRFILTGKDTPTQYDLGVANIPIPFREFPKNPVLKEQNAAVFTNSTIKAEEENNPIEDALKWNYTSKVFLEKIAAQDELWLDLTFNLPVKSLSGNDMNALLEEELPPLENLFQQLALFNAAYASIREEYFRQITLAIEDDQTDKLKEMVGILSPLIANVASAYEKLMTQEEAAQAEEEISIRHFVMSFKSINDDPSILTVFGDSPDISYFPVSINGETYPEGTAPVKVSQNPPDGKRTWYEVHYPYAVDGEDPGQLTTLWEALDSIEQQTALTTYWLIRNADLGDGKLRVNEDLIYETQKVAFANPILPLFTVEDIEVPPGEHIEDTLNTIFSTFAKAGSTSTQNRLLRAEVSYSYNILNFGGGQSGEMYVTTGTRLNFDLSLLPDGSSGNDSGTTLEAFSKAMATNLSNWNTANRPTQIPFGFQSRLHFNITLFADIDGSQLPLIKVKNTFTNIPNQDWWEVEN